MTTVVLVSVGAIAGLYVYKRFKRHTDSIPSSITFGKEKENQNDHSPYSLNQSSSSAGGVIYEAIENPCFELSSLKNEETPSSHPPPLYLSIVANCPLSNRQHSEGDDAGVDTDTETATCPSTHPNPAYGKVVNVPAPIYETAND